MQNTISQCRASFRSACSNSKFKFAMSMREGAGMSTIQIYIYHVQVRSEYSGKINNLNSPCSIQKTKHGKYQKSNLTC